MSSDRGLYLVARTAIVTLPPDVRSYSEPHVTTYCTPVIVSSWLYDIYETFNQGGMIWGRFCGGIESEHVFVPDKAKLDSAAYVTSSSEGCMEYYF